MPTSRGTERFEFVVGGKELLPQVKKLWEGLRDHHSDLNQIFGAEMRRFTFEQRHKPFAKNLKPNGMRIEMVRDRETGEAIGYSLSSVERGGKGELDSLFVREGYRSSGLGDQLTQRALRWLDEKQADPVQILVLFGNERVMSLYRRYGFEPRKIVMTRPKR